MLNPTNDIMGRAVPRAMPGRLAHLRSPGGYFFFLPPPEEPVRFIASLAAWITSFGMA